MCESFSWQTIVSGFVISLGCLYFNNKFLPEDKSSEISFFKLFLFMLYIIGQIYRAGITAIKIILFDAEVDIVEVKTKISNKFLRAVLMNSITLPPGTVALDIEGDTIAVLRFVDKTENSDDHKAIEEKIKGRIERELLKMQK